MACAVRLLRTRRARSTALVRQPCIERDLVVRYVSQIAPPTEAVLPVVVHRTLVAIPTTEEVVIQLVEAAGDACLIGLRMSDGEGRPLTHVPRLLVRLRAVA